MTSPRRHRIASAVVVAAWLVATACGHASAPTTSSAGNPPSPGAGRSGTEAGSRSGTGADLRTEPRPRTSGPGDTPETAAPVPPERLLVVYRVDDAEDVLRTIKDADVPDGVDIRSEMVAVGDRPKVRSTFAVAPVQRDEAPDAAAGRLRSWLGTVPHPFGTLFVIESVFEDGDAGPRATVGYRSLLVREPAIFDGRDVAEAEVATVDTTPMVRIRLGPEGTSRLELATRDWTSRRIAIVVDGLVAAAPVVMEPIRAGRASIPATGETPEARRANAERLARALSRR